MSRYCTGCGAEREAGDRFCTRCGMTLETTHGEPASEEIEEVREVEGAASDSTFANDDAGETASAPTTESETTVLPGEPDGVTGEPHFQGGGETSTVENISESVRRGAGAFSAAASGYAGRHAPKVMGKLPEPVRGAVSGFVGSGKKTGGANGLRSDVIYGAISSFVVACVFLILIYLILALRGILSSEFVPSDLGFTIFSLLHGGNAYASMSGYEFGGDISVGLPVTSFSLLPLIASFVIGWILAAKKSAGYGFVLGFALLYGTICGIFSLLGRITLGTEFLSVILSTGVISTAFWGTLITATGAFFGVSRAGESGAFGGRVRTLLQIGGRTGLHARRAVEGAAIAFVIGISPTVLFCLFDVLACGYGAVLGEEGACSGRGVLVALLPTLIGDTWLLSHGVPIGAASSFEVGDFSDLAALLGTTIPEIPTRLSLFGDWPFSDSWKLMVIVPVVALFLGGAVAARDTHRSDRIFQGVLVAVPYTIIAAVVSLLAGITASVTILDYAVEVALRVPAHYLLLIMLFAAIFGGLGGYFAGHPLMASLRIRVSSSRIFRKVYEAGGDEHGRVS